MILHIFLNYYIPNMPEYKNLISEKDGEGRELKLTQIINDIYIIMEQVLKNIRQLN